MSAGRGGEVAEDEGVGHFWFGGGVGGGLRLVR